MYVGMLIFSQLMNHLPQTPYERVMASNHVSDEEKDRLQTVHKALNPSILKKSIERKLRVIFKMVKVTSNVRQRI
jgi:hypothetical protein